MPSAVAGVIEISRRRRVSTITTAHPSDMTTHRMSPWTPPEPSEPPTMIATPARRRAHRDPGADGYAFAHPDPREQRGEKGRDGLEEQDVGNARVVERQDEAARGERQSDRDDEAGTPDTAEGGERAAAPA